MRARLIVCDTCRYSAEEKLSPDGLTGGGILAGHIETLAGSGGSIAVCRHSCLMGCEHACNVALSQKGKFTYVLGGFRPDTEAAEAIVDFARKYAASGSGQVPYRTWPQGVKGHFISRVPDLSGEDVPTGGGGVG